MDIPKGDKLVLRGLKFHGYHGVKQEERKLGQKFLVDVDAWMDLRAAGESDCLSDTLSYTDIYRVTHGLMGDTRYPVKFVEVCASWCRHHGYQQEKIVCSNETPKLSNSHSVMTDGRIVKEVIKGPPKNLLESVAQLIASTTLTKYPQVSAVRVQVGKPHVAVQGPVDYLGVEIIRYRNLDVQN